MTQLEDHLAVVADAEPLLLLDKTVAGLRRRVNGPLRPGTSRSGRARCRTARSRPERAVSTRPKVAPRRTPTPMACRRRITSRTGNHSVAGEPVAGSAPPDRVRDGSSCLRVRCLSDGKCSRGVTDAARASATCPTVAESMGLGVIRSAARRGTCRASARSGARATEGVASQERDDGPDQRLVGSPLAANALRRMATDPGDVL